MLSVHPRAFNRRANTKDEARFYAKGFKIFPSEDDCELLNAPRGRDVVELTSQLITDLVWSPVIFNDGVRNEKSFLGSEWIALDFDSGVYSLDQACADWEPYCHIIGVTRSHQQQKGQKPPCDRFRLLIRLGDFVQDIRLYKAILARAITKLGADEQCKDAARFFWPCSRIISYNVAGKVVATEPYLRELARCDGEGRAGSGDVGNAKPGAQSGAREGQRVGGNHAGPPDTICRRPARKYEDKRGMTWAIEQMIHHGAYQEGERNKRVFQCACDMARNGNSQGEIFDFCRGRTNLPDNELRDTVASAFQKRATGA